MEKELLRRLERNQVRCSKCKLIVPFTFRKGTDCTISSFTLVDNVPICYKCYHAKEFSLIDKQRTKKKK